MIDVVKANIKAELKKRGSNTNKLCKVLGKDRKYIYRTTDGIKLDKLIDIANAIGCTSSELVAGL